jgi:hypothetical protein
MPELVKATLTELDGDLSRPGELSPPMDVQLNPASLRLSINSPTDGGKTLTRPQHQHLGAGSRTLSMELVFDTADEGTTGEPRPVTERTAMVERFLLPRRAGDRTIDPPPRVRFAWGSLTVEGVVDSLSIDIDHFAANGTPLRARCSLTIREQDASLELRESSSPGRAAARAPTPTTAAAGVPGLFGGSFGGGGITASARVGVAIGGESLADFSARMGLDPSAWRGLAAGLDATLSLEAGAEIGFSASAGLGAGLGATAGLASGVSADASASLFASFGVDADPALERGAAAWGGSDAGLGGGAVTRSGSRRSASTSVTAGGGSTAGLGLSAAGGLQSAIESVKTVYAEAAARTARSAFADPAAGTVAGASRTLPDTAGVALAGSATARSAATGTVAPAGARRQAGAAAAVPAAAGTTPPLPRPGPPEQPRTPLKDTGLPGAGRRPAPAPAPPRADPRAVTFGLGVPLRPTRGEAAGSRARGSLGLPPISDDPQVPPWQALPASAATAAEPGRAERRSALECLCLCPPRRRGPGSPRGSS